MKFIYFVMGKTYKTLTGLFIINIIFFSIYANIKRREKIREQSQGSSMANN